jgi:hypothetical protein
MPESLLNRLAGLGDGRGAEDGLVLLRGPLGSNRAFTRATHSLAEHGLRRTAGMVPESNFNRLAPIGRMDVDVDVDMDVDVDVVIVVVVVVVVVVVLFVLVWVSSRDSCSSELILKL